MKIKICNGKACQNNFSSYIIARLQNDIKRFNLEKVEIEEVDCLGMCEEGPIVKIDKNILTKATPIKASEMMFKRLNNSSRNNGKKQKKEKKPSEEEN